MASLAILDEHLRNHINKENEVLFPIADKVFTQKDQQELLASFEQHEAKGIGEGVHERYHQFAHELAQKCCGKEIHLLQGVFSSSRGIFVEEKNHEEDQSIRSQRFFRQGLANAPGA